MNGHRHRDMHYTLIIKIKEVHIFSYDIFTLYKFPRLQFSAGHIYPRVLRWSRRAAATTRGSGPRKYAAC